MYVWTYNNSKTLTVAAAVYTEHLFKTGVLKKECFLEQQFWLYLYGAAVALCVHMISQPNYTLNAIIQDVNCMCLKTLFVASAYGGLLTRS